MIIAENLSKTYLVEKKKANLLATLKHFFNREFVKIKAVQNINLSIFPSNTESGSESS